MKSLPATLMFSVHRLIAVSLAMAVLNLSASVALASLPDSAVALGMIEVSGVVTVNDFRALSGETILSGSHILTGSKSDSTLELGNFTRLILSEQTDLALDFSAAKLSGSLRQGEIRAFIPATRNLRIMTPDGVVATDSSQTVVFSVQVGTSGTRLSVEKGRIELRSGNNRRVLTAGETFSTACDSFAVPALPQNLSKGERAGIFAGIGAGIAILLVAITVGEHREMLNFGGCAIAPSGSNDNPGICH